MGTHPIFESDFDCLTDGVPSGDLSDDETVKGRTQAVFKHLTLLCQGPLTPTRVLADFERAVRDAVKSEMSGPDTNLSGCYAYFSGCLQRNTLKRGLTSLFSSSPFWRYFYNTCITMPYVDANYYKDELINFLQDGVKHAKKSHSQKLSDVENFMIHFIRTWINGSHGCPMSCGRT